MKFKSFFLKTAVLIIASVVLLTAAILGVTAMESVSEQNDTGERFLPELGGFIVEDTPKPQLSLAEKFGVYTTVYEQNGIVTAEIYSNSQIKELNDRRNKLEALLTPEEILYLINDTITLFSSCDIIRINSENNDFAEYNGFREMLTDEFLNSTNNFIHHVTIDVDGLTESLLQAILKRLRPLHYALNFGSFDNDDVVILLTGVPTGITRVNVAAICYRYLNSMSFDSILCETPCGMFCFSYSGTIKYASDISNTDIYSSTTVFSKGSLPKELTDPYTYMISKKGVVIDIWDIVENVKVTGICLSDKDNGEAVEKIEKLWLSMTINTTAPRIKPDDTDECRYIACVYFKGIAPFSGHDLMNSFYYLPESDPDSFGFSFKNKPFDTICISGSRALAEYLNEIIAEYIDF